jgi:hypothetical protein
MGHVDTSKWVKQKHGIKKIYGQRDRKRCETRGKRAASACMDVVLGED